MVKSKQWSRLDNAAKIFPPTISRRDPKVFRFVCEMTQEVDGAILQRAVEQTIAQFPLYRSVLKKGLFWYYFEDSELTPRVTRENLQVCAPLYHADKPGLLFRVSYYKHRVNLEIFHALTDGSGALQFLRALVFAYLAERHGLPGRLEDYDAARDQQIQDAFYQHYDKKQKAPPVRRCRAYRIRGERLPADRLGITEGFLSAKAVLEQAHRFDATLSEFLVALLICSIHDGMAVRERARPVVVTVPVDLRRFFAAQTARNFFGVIQIAHDFRKDGREFDRVLARVREDFARHLTRESLHGIISRYSSIENNPLVKVIPLQLKIPFLRLAGWWADGEDTAAFSNVGRVSMPPEAARHIRLFDVFLSTKRPQLCLCSFGDSLAVSVSSPLRDTGLQRRFFRSLSEMGIQVAVASNLEQVGGEEEEEHATV